MTRRRRRFFVPLFFAGLGLLAAAAFGAGGTAEGPAPEEPESEVFRLEVTTLDGEARVIEAGGGRILVLNWWATWCGPCRREIPELDQVAELWGGRDDVELVAISPEEAAPVRAFLAELEFGFDHYLAPDLATQELLGASLPRSLVYDRDGQLLLDRTGYRRDTVYKIAALLRRLAPVGSPDP